MMKLTHNPHRPTLVITAAGLQIAMQVEEENHAAKHTVQIVVNGYRVHVEVMPSTAQNGATTAPDDNANAPRNPEVSTTQKGGE